MPTAKSEAAPFDWYWSEGEEIKGCWECVLTWRAELVPSTGGLVVREWHAADCKIWEVLASADQEHQT